MNDEYLSLDDPDESGYRSKPKLRELAAHLKYHANNLQREGHTPAEVRQFLLGYTACFLDAEQDDEMPADKAPARKAAKRSTSRTEVEAPSHDAMPIKSESQPVPTTYVRQIPRPLNNGVLPTGVKLSTNRERFVASIKNPETRTTNYLGSFDTPEEAHEVYKRKHAELYGERSPYFNEVLA